MMKSATRRAASAAPTAAASPDLRGGKGVEELEAALRQIAATKSWDVAEPLPTTREIGDRFAVSNATVCRLLIRLSADGVIWRRDNGRYYLNESRRMLELHKPYACLLRKLQNWSRVYQAVMSGFSQAFGRDATSMLIVHNDTLVRHADTAHPPLHASAAQQRQSLQEFLRAYRAQFRGMLLDEVWSDEVLREFNDELANAVIVCRPTTLPGLSSVSADFDAAALLAVGHLYARGFEEVWLAIPFEGLATFELFTHAVRRAGSTLGSAVASKNICSVALPSDRARFVERLKSSRKRIGVFCLEDNMAVILREALADACPRRVGLLSGMGTDLVTDRKISSVRIDYEAIGRGAGEILLSGKVQHVTVQPQLVTGTTT